ncbi:MAG: hypothetical protein ACE14T_02905 [Syntrophales bacterium]
MGIFHATRHNFSALMMYDAVIIGNDLSSLVTALTAVRQGRKILLLADGPVPEPYAEAGYTFDVDPLPWTSLLPEETFFSAVMRDHLSGDSFRPARLQVLLPEHRIDLFTTGDDLIRDMEREFPQCSEEIRKLYALLARGNEIVEGILKKSLRNGNPYRNLLTSIRHLPALIRERILLSLIFKRIKNNPPLMRVIDAEIRLFSSLFAGENHALSAARVLLFPVKGIHYPWGGKQLILNELRKQFQSMGGQTRQNCSIREISIAKQIDIELIENNESTAVHARYLVVSTKWERLESLFKDGKISKWLSKKRKIASDVYYPFTVHMGVHDRGIPESMGPNVLLIVDINKPLYSTNLIFLELSMPGDTARAPQGKRAVSATVFLTDSPLRQTDDQLRMISEQMLENLNGFLPFLKECMDILNLDKSMDISRKYQEVVNRKYGINRNFLTGISPFSNKSPRKNVIMNGGALFAGIGFEGEVLAGIEAAYKIAGGKP